MSDELKKEKERLIFQLNEIDAEISIIDLKIKEIAASVDRPDEIIDEVLSLSIKKKKLKIRLITASAKMLLNKHQAL